MENQLIEIHSGTDIFSNKILKENINMLNQRLYALELKLDTMEKNSGIRADYIIEKIQKTIEMKLLESMQALLPYFECIFTNIQKVNKKSKKMNNSF